MKVELRDIDNGNEQAIDKAGASLNIVRPLPPFSNPTTQKMRPFRQFLSTDGTTSGTTDMRTNGSTTNVDFFVEAQDNDDLYITTLSFVIADALAALNSFGTITALTNGCVLEYQDERGTVTIHEALKSNFDFVRLCLGKPPFGDGTSAFRATNVSGASEGYIPVLDIRDTFGFQWGILLRAGTKQRLTMRVRDDTTGVDAFNCIAYGFTREKD